MFIQSLHPHNPPADETVMIQGILIDCVGKKSPEPLHSIIDYTC
jgi:hypothetical protein